MRFDTAVLACLAAIGGCSSSTGDGRTATKHGETITCPPGTTPRDRGAVLACVRGAAEYHGPYIEWSLSPDRHKALEGTYVDGRKEGVWTQYHRNGTKYGQGETRNDVRHGTWKSWSETGDLVLISEYDQGRRTGTWNYFAGGKNTQVEEYAGDVLQRRLVLGDQGELQLSERWEHHASGLQVHRSETHGGDATPSVITVHRDRSGSRTYHEIAGKLVKVERLENGQRVHVTECRDGQPSRTYWIAGNGTPGHPRREVDADLTTASSCAGVPAPG